MPLTMVIVQARMGSSRLPGKVLMDLGGRPVLDRVIERCRQIAGVDVVCIAVPEALNSDPVAALALACGAAVHRGPELDVLERYRGAAEALRADYVMRVTSDCPLIDPEVCRQVLALVQSSGADYACNNMPRGFPHGLDCEAFTRAALERCGASARAPAEREHVTPWLRNDASIRRTALSGPGGEAAQHRWTLDYPEDYEFLQALFHHLPANAAALGYRETMAIIAREPRLTSLHEAAARRAEKEGRR